MSCNLVGRNVTVGGSSMLNVQVTPHQQPCSKWLVPKRNRNKANAGCVLGLVQLSGRVSASCACVCMFDPWQCQLF